MTLPPIALRAHGHAGEEVAGSRGYAHIGLHQCGCIIYAVAGYLDSTLLRNFSASLFALHFHTVDSIFLVAGYGQPACGTRTSAVST